MARKKNIWDRLEVKTGKQITLWVLTALIILVFGDAIAEVVRNVTTNPPLFTALYFSLFILFRIVLGYLFDND